MHLTCSLSIPVQVTLVPQPHGPAAAASQLLGTRVNNLHGAVLVLFPRAQHTPCNELSCGLKPTVTQMCGLVSSVRMESIGFLDRQTEIVALAHTAILGFENMTEVPTRPCTEAAV